MYPYINYAELAALDYGIGADIDVNLSATQVALIYYLVSVLTANRLVWQDYDTNYDAIDAMLADLAARLDSAIARELMITEVEFAFDSTYPLLIKALEAGETVDELLITVDTPFDAGNLTVGDGVNPSRLITAAYNDLLEAGQYQVSPQYQYGSATNVYAYLTGSPTVGAGRITLYTYTES